MHADNVAVMVAIEAAGLGLLNDKGHDI